MAWLMGEMVQALCCAEPAINLGQAGDRTHFDSSDEPVEKENRFSLLPALNTTVQTYFSINR